MFKPDEKILEKNESQIGLLNLTSDIVASHVSNNEFEANKLPDLIREVYNTLSSLAMVGKPTKAPTRTTPAVAIEDSIKPDFLVCLEDGRTLKMLKRHLRSAYNMSPDAYRERWGLPADYPMVAPNYAKKRSSLALESGLGKNKAAS